MAIIIIAIVLLRIIAEMVPFFSEWLLSKWGKIKMLLRKRYQRNVFDEYFIEAKAFYQASFNALPSIIYINSIDGGKLFELINTHKFGKVQDTYQRNWYNWQQERLEFSKTLFKLEGELLIKLGDEWAEILYSKNDFARANKIAQDLRHIKHLQKKKITRSIL